MPNSLVTLHGLEQKIKKKKSHFLVEKHVLVVLLFFLFFYRFTSAPPDFQWINVYIYLKKNTFSGLLLYPALLSTPGRWYFRSRDAFTRVLVISVNAFSGMKTTHDTSSTPLSELRFFSGDSLTLLFFIIF